MPRTAALTERQLTFEQAQESVFETHAAEMRALYIRALRENAISQEHLAHITGKDPSHLSRMLAGNGAHISLDVQAAIISLDAKRIVIQGMSRMCGGEWRKTEPDPAAEARLWRERCLAMRDELDRLLTGSQP